MIAVRLGCCAFIVLAATAVGPLPAAAQENCAAQVGKLMSRQVDKLNTSYHRISERLEREGSNSRLAAQGCRIARALEPRLRRQLAALKRSGCSKDPDMGMAVTDLMRGHEADLAAVRKTAAATCK